MKRRRPLMSKEIYTLPSMKCKNCKYYVEIDSDKGGCLRYPPQTMCLESEHRFSRDFIFKNPTVHKDYWCGEFKEHESKEGNHENSN